MVNMLSPMPVMCLVSMRFLIIILTTKSLVRKRLEWVFMFLVGVLSLHASKF
jgi:hypothetical protein